MGCEHCCRFAPSSRHCGLHLEICFVLHRSGRLFSFLINKGEPDSQLERGISLLRAISITMATWPSSALENVIINRAPASSHLIAAPGLHSSLTLWPGEWPRARTGFPQKQGVESWDMRFPFMLILPACPLYILPEGAEKISFMLGAGTRGRC